VKNTPLTRMRYISLQNFHQVLLDTKGFIFFELPSVAQGPASCVNPINSDSFVRTLLGELHIRHIDRHAILCYSLCRGSIVRSIKYLSPKRREPTKRKVSSATKHSTWSFRLVNLAEACELKMKTHQNHYSSSDLE